ncbi:MAG: hypothetical protein ACK4GC_16000 [Paracoccaceae bacterium]
MNLVALPSLVISLAAALFEMATSSPLRTWLKLGESAWWRAPGVAWLRAFAVMLTLAPTDAAGRAHAAHGGVCLAASRVWQWVIKSQPHDRGDFAAAVIRFLGAAFILLLAPSA